TTHRSRSREAGVNPKDASSFEISASSVARSSPPSTCSRSDAILARAKRSTSSHSEAMGDSQTVFHQVLEACDQPPFLRGIGGIGPLRPAIAFFSASPDL